MMNKKGPSAMGISDHLTCLLRNLYAGQEATVSTGHGITDGLQIGKGACQGSVLSPLPMNIQELFTLGWTGWISFQAKILSRVFSFRMDWLDLLAVQGTLKSLLHISKA